MSAGSCYPEIACAPAHPPLCTCRDPGRFVGCRYAGDLELVYETTTAGITIQAPQLDVHTVAAGGGSRLFLRAGMFAVGPESAGAHPGPVCYRKPGGQLAVTDANLVLGRVQPDMFPRIFGEKVRCTPPPTPLPAPTLNHDVCVWRLGVYRRRTSRWMWKAAVLRWRP